MAGEVRAVIDVGTNSVKLLVADVEKGIIRPLHEGSHQTRLGQGFYQTKVLQSGAIDLTAKVVSDFVSDAQAWKPTNIKVIATSAARDAENKEELISAIESASGTRVTIISGEQEADWAYRGVASDPKLAGGKLLVMDIGGGSTEFILGNGEHYCFAKSFSLGSVRLLEQMAISENPSEQERINCERILDEFITHHIYPQLAPMISEVSGPIQLVGTGGTSTILARVYLKLRSFNREMIEGTFLSREILKSETLRLWRTSLEERKKIIGLPPNRADVILPGALIFDRVMQIFGLPSLRVSTRGLRFAALID